MLQVAIIGASGYTGMELARLVAQHPQMSLQGLYVSAESADAGMCLGELYGVLTAPLFHTQQLALTPLSDDMLPDLAHSADIVFLATPHHISHAWLPILITGKAKVLDLSGAFRLSTTSMYQAFYDFSHRHPQLLQQAVYGLPEWHSDDIRQSQYIAVPGCYPTASLLALKPLLNAELLDPAHRPIISAVSGVSGAGRKASQTSSFCEVSLHAYGILRHRHQPEISEQLGTPVIFTPHLGNFKRGIIATAAVKLRSGASAQAVQTAYGEAYRSASLVHVRPNAPKIDDVANGPECHLHWQFDAESGYLVVTSAIDNLLKGAASQALQCANLMHNFAHDLSLTEYCPAVPVALSPASPPAPQ